MPSEEKLAKILFKAIRPQALKKRVTARMDNGLGPYKGDTRKEAWRRKAKKNVKLLCQLILENANHMDFMGMKPISHKSEDVSSHKEESTGGSSSARSSSAKKKKSNTGDKRNGQSSHSKGMGPSDSNRADDGESEVGTEERTCHKEGCNNKCSKNRMHGGYFKYCIEHKSEHKGSFNKPEDHEYEEKGAEKVYPGKCAAEGCSQMRGVKINGDISPYMLQQQVLSGMG